MRLSVPTARRLLPAALVREFPRDVPSVFPRASNLRSAATLFFPHCLCGNRSSVTPAKFPRFLQSLAAYLLYKLHSHSHRRLICSLLSSIQYDFDHDGDAQIGVHGLVAGRACWSAAGILEVGVSYFDSPFSTNPVTRRSRSIISTVSRHW